MTKIFFVAFLATGATLSMAGIIPAMESEIPTTGVAEGQPTVAQISEEVAELREELGNLRAGTTKVVAGPRGRQGRSKVTRVVYRETDGWKYFQSSVKDRAVQWSAISTAQATANVAIVRADEALTMAGQAKSLAMVALATALMAVVVGVFGWFLPRAMREWDYR